MKTAFSVFLIVASISATFGELNNVEKQICEPKSTFKNYCNVCLCSDDGLTAECSKGLCYPPEKWNPDGTLAPVDDTEEFKKLIAPGQICIPRTRFNMFCNYCACNFFGTDYVCTRALCPEGMYTMNGTLLVDIA
ncbi:pacifastin-like protease inhibitor cvp4 [Trichogramma pretiosum]|uniref:pacifastin-like protease inhibitor cvp4 n=1 Tax=Trichogramma pretiosum TaxID=7493 RepID=UPI0006C99A3C|nr:pacifastin-like protease inhibitor cvp4 [Trichogramma pretiosum]